MEWGRLHCVTGSVAIFGETPYNKDNNVDVKATTSEVRSSILVTSVFDALETMVDLYRER